MHKEKTVEQDIAEVFEHWYPFTAREIKYLYSLTKSWDTVEDTLVFAVGEGIRDLRTGYYRMLDWRELYRPLNS